MRLSRHHWFFDFDGTLCDTEPDIRATWVTALRELGLDCPSFDGIYKTGPTLDEISLKLFPDASPALLASIRAAFKRNYDASSFPNTVPYPGVPAWLAALRAAGATLHIVTNKRQIPTLILLKKLGWQKLFTGVFCSDSDPANKRPKAVLLRDALAAEGAAASDAVMVGDTLGDIAAARANPGVEAFAVNWGYGKPDEIAGADRIVSLADIAAEARP